MSLPQQSFKNRSYQYTSGSSAASFSPPIAWVQVAAAGNLTMVDEAGNAVAYTGLLAGEVIPGPFSAFTSTTCARVRLGDGPPPPAAAAANAFSELYNNALTAQAQINIPLGTAILAAGTPMAAFADNASSNPGITLANSKAVGLRWNNNATQTAVWFSIPLPQDLDDTAAIVLHALVSTTGTTDSPTLTVTGFFQDVGALHDADSDVGGASSAYAGGTAKQVQELTLSISAANVGPAPCGLSFSIKPTDGTLGTDDCIVHDLWIEYTRKILAS